MLSFAINSTWQVGHVNYFSGDLLTVRYRNNFLHLLLKLVCIDADTYDLFIKHGDPSSKFPQIEGATLVGDWIQQHPHYKMVFGDYNQWNIWEGKQVLLVYGIIMETLVAMGFVN